MNAFEDVVKRYLEEGGYWVRQSVKIEITPEDKRAIGTYSMPRPEIDLVALNVERNELLLVEAKSYLDSYGVYYEAIADPTDKGAARYKLFTNEVFRQIVTDRLREQYLKRGLIKNDVNVNYCLAAGNIHYGNEKPIANYFRQKGWKLIAPDQIRDFIKQLATKGWEDDLVTMTVKLLKK
jgi:hypothetical protein